MIAKSEIKSARSGKTYYSLAEDVRLKALDGIVKRTYALKGYTVEATVQAEIDLTVRELSRKIVARWPGLTLGEIMLALEGGACGDYGDTRLTIANYINWLGTYFTSAERRDAIAELTREETRIRDTSRLLPQATLEEMNARATRTAALKAFETFRRTGDLGISLPGLAASIFDYLASLGKIRVSPETWEATVREKAGTKDARTIAEIIGAGVSRADWTCKRSLLEKYYGSLITRGVELNL